MTSREDSLLGTLSSIVEETKSTSKKQEKPIDVAQTAIAQLTETELAMVKKYVDHLIEKNKGEFQRKAQSEQTKLNDMFKGL